MESKTKYSLNQLRDYSALFSRSSAQEWIKGDLSSIDFKISRYDSNWLTLKNKSYVDYLKYVYTILEKNYKNEYILKNSFLNQWLIKELGETNSQVFSEFRIGNAVADLVMFNGVSKVFEIKTELDTDRRLTSQLKYYKKVFNEIYLIVPSSKVNHYKKFDKNIGIIAFDEDAINSFVLIQKPHTNKGIDFNTVMDIFHTSEYKKLVKLYFGQLPKTTSFNQYEICKELISQIPYNHLNQHFINFMKGRVTGNSLSSRYHKEFNQLSLALKLSDKKKKDMINLLKKPLNI